MSQLLHMNTTDATYTTYLMSDRTIYHYCFVFILTVRNMKKVFDIIRTKDIAGIFYATSSFVCKIYVLILLRLHETVFDCGKSISRKLNTKIPTINIYNALSPINGIEVKTFTGRVTYEYKGRNELIHLTFQNWFWSTHE